MDTRKPVNRAGTMNLPGCLVIRRGSVEKLPSRRPGLVESRLLSQSQSQHQNIVEVVVDEGAVIEYHQVATSESIYVLEGDFELVLSANANYGDSLAVGDLVHFRPGSYHGLRCVRGPGKLLVIFAPPLKRNGGSHDS